jgi:uncharacterized protein
MELTLIILLAFAASLLTFFSGFGLGTILTPVFMLQFPPEIAIAMSGMVHLANNIFKLGIIGKQADRATLYRFGVPSILGALAGAFLLLQLADLQPLYAYSVGDRSFTIQPLKSVIAVLLLLFTLLDLFPSVLPGGFGKKALIGGGLLSGFFGGLSGHQGALRTAFLIKAGLSKEAFIGTAVVVSTLVDLSRLGVYAGKWRELNWADHGHMIVWPALAAMAGAYFGKKLLQKVTLKWLQTGIAILLILFAVALGAGWL